MNTPEKKTPTRIYMVKHIGHDQSVRLIRATNGPQAIRHVAINTFEVCVASQEDLVALLSRGSKVEEAGAEPQTDAFEGTTPGAPT